MLMKLFPNFVLVIILLAFFVQPFFAYPEDFFELTGTGFEPPKYEPIGKISFAGEQATDCMRVLWFGDVANPPSGWTVDDANFFNRFMQGATTAGGTGGRDHNHTGAHTPTGNSHTHEITLNSETCANTVTANANPFGVQAASLTHAHSGTSTTNATTQTYQSTAPTTSDTNAFPIHLTANFIGPDASTSADIPVDAVVFSDGFSSTDFTIADGTGNAPNLDLNFVRGTPAIDTNGGILGGALEHGHVFDENHTHLGNTHVHNTDVASGNATLGQRGQSDIGAVTLPNKLETHNVNTNTLDQSDANGSMPTVDDNLFEPEHTFMFPLENSGASASTPDGIYVIWLCPSADIPSGWLAADGDNNTFDLSARQIKFTTDSTRVGDLNGSNSVGHETQSHQHTSLNAHKHVNNVASTLKTTIDIATGMSNYCTGQQNHLHPDLISNASPTLQSSDFNTSAVDSRPEFREVIFIKKVTTDTCTYSSGDFVVDCSDNCQITSDVDLQGNPILIVGTGDFGVQAVLRRVLYIEHDPLICSVTIYVNGGGVVEYGS